MSGNEERVSTYIGEFLRLSWLILLQVMALLARIRHVDVVSLGLNKSPGENFVHISFYVSLGNTVMCLLTIHVFGCWLGWCYVNIVISQLYFPYNLNDMFSFQELSNVCMHLVETFHT